MVGGLVGGVWGEGKEGCLQREGSIDGSTAPTVPSMTSGRASPAVQERQRMSAKSACRPSSPGEGVHMGPTSPGTHQPCDHQPCAHQPWGQPVMRAISHGVHQPFARQPWSTAYSLLPATHHLPPTGHYPLATTYNVPPTTHHLPPTAHCPLPTTHYSPLPTAHYPPPTTHYLPLTTSYLPTYSYRPKLTTCGLNCGVV